MGKLFNLKDAAKSAPSPELAEEFKNGGITFRDERKLSEMILASLSAAIKPSPADMEEALKSFLTVSVDLAVGEEFTEAQVPGFSIQVLMQHTGRKFYFTDFGLSQIGDQKVLRFNASMYIPERVLLATPGRERSEGVVALSFLDLCFGGAQEIQATETDTITALREGAVYADIAWVLPSRFVDTLIDAMGKLNDTMFDGMLRESIIYARA